MAEMEQAVKEMKDVKLPGADATPKEFYSNYWNIVKEDLFKACNLALAQGELLFSQKGIIRLIPKPKFWME